MTGKAKYLFIAGMDVEPGKEALFNEVYDAEHVPELLKVPGVLSIRRAVREPLTLFLGGENKAIVADGEPRAFAGAAVHAQPPPRAAEIALIAA